PDSHFQLNIRREHNLACVPRSASHNVYQHFCKVFARKASNQSKPRTEFVPHIVVLAASGWNTAARALIKFGDNWLNDIGELLLLFLILFWLGVLIVLQPFDLLVDSLFHSSFIRLAHFRAEFLLPPTKTISSTSFLLISESSKTFCTGFKVLRKRSMFSSSNLARVNVSEKSSPSKNDSISILTCNMKKKHFKDGNSKTIDKTYKKNIIYLVTSTKCSFGFFDFTTQFLNSSIVFADILALLLLI
ncbi:hypothetical protein ALC53_13317, partial [Atta colombica]